MMDKERVFRTFEKDFLRGDKKGNDLFFITKAKHFDINNENRIAPLIKNKWRQKVERATAKPAKYRRYIKLLLDLIGFKPGYQILDVGCGVGAEVIELAYLGANCVGLDAAEDAIRLINKVRDKFGLNVETTCCDACNLPFNNGVFDVVMSMEFFEHVSDPDLALKEQIRVLKNGGRLIIEQANLLNPFSLFNLLVKYPVRTKGKYGGTKWLFTKGKVRKNIYGTGWAGKDEDIHTRLWWRMKIRNYPELKTNEFTSLMVKKRDSFFKLLEPFMGNILIIATKRGVANPTIKPRDGI